MEGSIGKRGLGIPETVPDATVAWPEAMPDDSWDLPVLAEFIAHTARRNGRDAWVIGKALYIARAKHTRDRDWLQWLRKDVPEISKSTAYRYIDVHKSFSWEQVHDTPLSVLYQLMKLQDDDEEPEEEEEVPTGNGEVQDEPDGTDAVGQQGPTIAGRINEQETDAIPDEHQPPITDREFGVLEAFVTGIGSLVRAEYVFRSGVEQIRELQCEE